MIQHWRRLTFLHWRYPPDQVQALLPAGLTVETFDGSAWVGVIPFRMAAVRPSVLPALPWLSWFPETNVRTYVHGPDGRTGIWFFSLEAARLVPVLIAQAGFGLPYRWADMSVDDHGSTVLYRSRRRWPGRPGARCDATVRPGAPLEPGPLDHFLTARYRLYSRYAGRLVAANAEHPPWSLYHGEVTRLDQDLAQAAGLPGPGHDPLVHTSPGVRVRIGMWRPV
jgi:uncharacterized protein YqjF (DUF2071 family)